MNVAGITITLNAHHGFYFDHRGYIRSCVFVTADGDPMYAVDVETQRDDLDPDECFAIVEGDQS